MKTNTQNTMTSNECAYKLILGKMPKGIDPSFVIALGPGCFEGEEEFFPDWEQKFRFAPDPLAQKETIPKAIAAAKNLCSIMIPPLSHSLTKDAAKLPPIYFETLLLPWLSVVAEQCIERWLRIQSLIALFGNSRLSIDIAQNTPSFSFLDTQDFMLRGALGDTYNFWLNSYLIQHADIPKTWILTPKKIEVHPPAQKTKTIVQKIRAAVRHFFLELPFPHVKGVSLTQSLLFSLALCHKVHGVDRSQSLMKYDSTNPLPFDPTPIFLASLPKSYTTLTHPKTIAKARIQRLYCASIVSYEDASYAQRLSLLRAKGHRLMYVQHGGNYGMIRYPFRTLLVELAQHCFITWGWDKYPHGSQNYIPLPYPQLTAIANKHRERESSLLFVGAEMPAYGYRLDSHPTPLQIVAYRNAKKIFLESLDPLVRNSVSYRPYFPHPGTLLDAKWVTKHFPKITLCKGPLTPKILATRLLVLDHHGTTLLEAMAANVPTVFFFDPSYWALSDTFLEILKELEEAHIYFPNAKAAAGAINSHWHDIKGWWQDTARQRARTHFCSLFAQSSSDLSNDTSTWVSTLRHL